MSRATARAQLLTVRAVAALSMLSPRQVRSLIKAGELGGFKRKRIFWDPGRGRRLLRRWWVVPVSELEAYYARMIEQGRRGYVPRAKYAKDPNVIPGKL